MMFTRTRVLIGTLVVIAGALTWAALIRRADAHCDTMDGPVVKSARTALAKGDVTPVLKWIKPSGEAEVKAAFKQTLVVRKESAQAKQLADRYFFETLVRLHRESEGEPYTGLKPSGTEVGPAVAGADRALESGNVDGLVSLLNDEVATGIRKRFAQALETKKHADESVPAGRKFVAAYVEFVHYAERLHDDAAGATETGHAHRGE